MGQTLEDIRQNIETALLFLDRPACVTLTPCNSVVVKYLSTEGEIIDGRQYLSGNRDGSYVFYWAKNGDAKQVFGRGGAADAWNSADPVKQAKQKARDHKAKYIPRDGLEAWAAENVGKAREVGKKIDDLEAELRRVNAEIYSDD